MHRVWPEGPGFSLLDSVSWPGHLLGGLVVGLWLAMAQPSAQSFVRGGFLRCPPVAVSDPYVQPKILLFQIAKREPNPKS